MPRFRLTFRAPPFCPWPSVQACCVSAVCVSLLRIGQDSVLMLLDEVPVLRHRLLRDLVARNRSLTRKSITLTTLTAKPRVNG